METNFIGTRSLGGGHDLSQFYTVCVLCLLVEMLIVLVAIKFESILLSTA